MMDIITQFAECLLHDFRNMVSIIRAASYLTKEVMDSSLKMNTIQDHVLVFGIAIGLLLLFIFFTSNEERNQLYNRDFRNWRPRSNLMHKFAYANKNHMIFLYGASDIAIICPNNPLLKMEQYIWHEVMIDYKDMGHSRIIAISRDAAGSRLKILEEYLPRCLAMIVIDYTFKRLRKRRNARQLRLY